MPHGIYNGSFKEVDKFLREHGFTFIYIRGSHHFYTGIVNGIKRQVCVPRHNNKSISPFTLKNIILQSGIDKKEWIGK